VISVLILDHRHTTDGRIEWFSDKHDGPVF
jgi:hypothetical protein